MNFFLFFERAFCENSSVNILGIDYGHKRVGLSYADTTLGVAVPIDAAVESTAEARMSHIERVIKERRINKIIIGYPFNMDGTIGDKAREVDAYIKELEKFGLEIERVDERLSSFQAENDFRPFRCESRFAYGRIRPPQYFEEKQRSSGQKGFSPCYERIFAGRFRE